MTSPFIEAQQFRGVWPDPAKLEVAQRELAKPVEQRDPPFNSRDNEHLLLTMMRPPPFDGRVSLYFKDGTSFDIQEGSDGRQYIALPRESKATLHPQAHIGDWICQLPSGKFIKMSDEDYRALTS